MIQTVMQKCQETEALCNEFYLQLIKQTTDHPGKFGYIYFSLENRIGQFMQSVFQFPWYIRSCFLGKILWNSTIKTIDIA